MTLGYALLSLGMLGLIGYAGFLFVKLSAHRTLTRPELEAIASRLGGTLDGHVVQTRVGGDLVTVRQVFTPAQNFLHFEIALRYPLVLYAIGGSGGLRVEGAPSDVVRQLIDEPTRELLASLDYGELSTPDDAQVLRLVVLDGSTDPAIAARIATGLARIVRRGRDVYAKLEEDIPLEQVGPAFRGEISDEARRRAAELRAGEVERLERLATARRRREAAVMRAVGIVFVAGTISAFVAAIAVLF